MLNSDEIHFKGSRVKRDGEGSAWGSAESGGGIRIAREILGPEGLPAC